jgi:iron complex outermembrane receptor protein
VPLYFGAGVRGTAERGIAALTVKATTAELRLVSTGEQRLAWTLGAYAKHDRRAQQRAGLIVRLPDDGLPLDETLYSTPARVRAQAVFGDAEWQLLPAWALQAGLRHYRSENQTQVRFDTTSAIFPGYTAGVVRDSGSRARATTPKLGLSWKPGPALMVFASVSTGFRDGDSNFQPADHPEVNAAYGPEKVRAVELGLKSQPWGWLTLNASVYRNDWTDLQLPFVTNDGLFGYIQNAGRARATGAELEAVARPTDSLRLGLNLAAVDATIDEARSGNGGADLGGKRVPFSPRLQVSLSVVQRFALQAGLEALLAANWAHRSTTESEPTNDSRLRNPASQQLYLQASLNGAAWGGKLYVANATQSTASHKRTAGAAGGVVDISPVQPRTVGAELSARF